MKARYFSILLLLFSATTAHAESSLILGVQGGHAKLDSSFDGFDMDSSSSSARIYAGWQINSYFSVTGGYQTFGDFEKEVTGDRVSVHADGFTLATQAEIPFSSRFSGVVEIGAFFWDGNASINDVTSANPSESNLHYSMGLRYRVSDTFRLTADWRRYDLDQAESRVIGAGLEFMF